MTGKEMGHSRRMRVAATLGAEKKNPYKLVTALDFFFYST
jgi:hypothetical protein